MRFFSILILLVLICACSSPKKKVLIFSKTAGYHHESISDGIMAIQKMGKKNNFDVDTTSSSSLFEEEFIKSYAAIIFLSTTGDVFDKSQESVFERYIQAGGGFVGIHAASDTEYDWPWFNQLVGAYFASHPQIQEARLDVIDNTHPSTAHLNYNWVRTDEWYNFKSINEKTNRLINIDESSYTGGTNGKIHPMSWYHQYDGGKAWYTALGHTKESYEEEAFLKHLLGGINYAMDHDALDYSKTKTTLIPVANRFGLNRLIQGVLVEPTEMTILPNEDVLITQRRGEILRYFADNKTYKTLGKLKVYHSTDEPNVNVEEGLMGLTKDPNFSENGFIYLYYSPVEISVNRLSRFFIDSDSIHMASEKIILDVDSDRDICCHTGGSLAFSPDGKALYLSTGDNATPFDEEGSKYVNKGYAPQDNRIGHEQYDARRSSANTNDLRGKILRIGINPDGTYYIPEGNLFPEKSDLTRPEIFVMGTRNPYRISIDQRSGDLYWGEVGPDAGADNSERGPMGYDEINRATVAGNYGWPLFVADNQAYNQYDYNTGISGPKHNPNHPINNSISNTGLTELPPAQTALIYYPYDVSSTFPSLASGGRNAMAGPVYYSDMFPKTEAYPIHFDGKLFIYDWIRQWIKVVELNESGEIIQIEDFLPNMEFANIIDMELGPKGQIYILEYGKGWFSKNSDASLTRIDYNSGNRVPKILEFKSDRKSGKRPLTLNFSLIAEDPENESLTYLWFKNNQKLDVSNSEVSITFEDIGQSIVKCVVSDEYGNQTSSEDMIVNCGNELATIDINILGNKSFFFSDHEVKYEINIQDDQKFNKNNLMIKHVVEGSDSSIGHLNEAASSLGERLIAATDCESCHKREEASIGPSYLDIANRYQDLSYAVAFLGEKIRTGGSGNWGEGAMAAHPTITESESMQIADWILSLNQEKELKPSLSMKGSIHPKIDKKASWKNTSYLRVSYSDNPSNGANPLSSFKEYKLRPNFYKAEFVNKSDNLELISKFNSKVLLVPNEPASLKFENIDLDEIQYISVEIRTENNYLDQYSFEFKNDQGELLSSNVSFKQIGPSYHIIMPIASAKKGKFNYNIDISPKKDSNLDEIFIHRISFSKN